MHIFVFVLVIASDHVYISVFCVQIVFYKSAQIADFKNRYFCFLLCIHLFAKFHYLLWFRHVNLISTVNSRISIFSKAINNASNHFQISYLILIYCFFIKIHADFYNFFRILLRIFCCLLNLNEGIINLYFFRGRITAPRNGTTQKYLYHA